MAAFAGKLVAKKFMKGRKDEKPSQDNPYFEDVEAQKYGVKYNSKRKRTLHAGLTAEEAEILATVKRRAYRLDMSLFNLCGLRFGWGSVIGIIPMVGDALDLGMAYSVMKTCNKVEPALPSDVKSKMFWNVIIDFVIGFVPILGDLADAAYKCNTKNAMLLEKELNKRADKRDKQAGGVLGTTRPDIVEEEFEMAPSEGAPPRYTSTKKSKSQRPQVANESHHSPGGHSADRQEASLGAGDIAAAPHTSNQGGRQTHRNDLR